MVDNGVSFPLDDAMDIVCGTLQVKLLTKELFSCTNRFIILGGNPLTPCDLQHKAGKLLLGTGRPQFTTKTSQFTVSYHDSSGKHSCWFEPQAFTGSQASVDPQPTATQAERHQWALQRMKTAPGPSAIPLMPPMNCHHLLIHMNFLPSSLIFQPVAQSNFQWGNLDAASFCLELDRMYQEVALWKKNGFSDPWDSAGKVFVCELARLFHATGKDSSLESTALKAIAVACVLLLQKPSCTSKDKDHVLLLEQQMKLWTEGDLISLITEGRAIQSCLKCFLLNKVSHKLHTILLNSCLKGKQRLPYNWFLVTTRGVLNLDEVADPAIPNNYVVHDVLQANHPSAQSLHINCLLPD